VRTIYHGVPEKLLIPRPIKPAYLAALGRIAPEKSMDRAIRIAQRCGIPLKIAAKVDPVDQEYYEQIIKPLLDASLVEYIGEISDQEKPEFLSGAMALLVTIDWPEPFGLVMIEAMACGTPVIAFNRGSVPEIVEDDITGYIVEDEISAVNAVRQIGQLDRQQVRRRFEERFTARRMALDYLAAYREVMQVDKPRLKVVTGIEH
jgi:glycosyltransferase involved in cell wall biosynthesis